MLERNHQVFPFPNPTIVFLVHLKFCWSRKRDFLLLFVFVFTSGTAVAFGGPLVTTLTPASLGQDHPLHQLSLFGVVES